jgi:hypothetical protein
MPVIWQSHFRMGQRTDGTRATCTANGKFYIEQNAPYPGSVLPQVIAAAKPHYFAINPTATTDAHNATLVTIHDSLIDVNATPPVHREVEVSIRNHVLDVTF